MDCSIDVLFDNQVAERERPRMNVSDAVAHVQAALSNATRDMSTKEYLEVLDELIDDLETRHSVAIEETGD